MIHIPEGPEGPDWSEAERILDEQEDEEEGGAAHEAPSTGDLRREDPRRLHRRGGAQPLEDREIIAWCARADVESEVDDAPRLAVTGWRDAALKASQHVGADPLVDVVSRIGIDEAARLYEETRAEVRAESRENEATRGKIPSGMSKARAKRP